MASYSVIIVDANGRSLEKVAVVPADANPSCCMNNAYDVTVGGTLPTGFDKFMIVPNFEGTTMSTAKHLPMGALTNTLVDVSTGLATKLEGSFTLTVSNAANFAADPKVSLALRSAIAATITGINEEHVRITGVTVARRLRSNDDSPRRLTSGSVRVNYVIYVPQALVDAGTTISSSSLAPATLLTNLNTKLTERGVQGSYTVTGSITVATAAPATVGTAPESGTGAARRSAELGAVVALFGALAMLLIQ